jgi:hypothetical protein
VRQRCERSLHVSAAFNDRLGVFGSPSFSLSLRFSSAFMMGGGGGTTQEKKVSHVLTGHDDALTTYACLAKNYARLAERYSREREERKFE